METDILKYTHEYDLQNKLKVLKILNAKVAKCNSGRSDEKNIIYEFTVQDDEILDPVKCCLKNDEETWLYVPKGCATLNESSEINNKSSSSNITSMLHWLGFSLQDIQLSNLFSHTASFNVSSSSSLLGKSSGLCSVSSAIKDHSFSDSLSDKGLRRNVDSRTYTRPKKRTFQSIVGRCFDDSSCDENIGEQSNNSLLSSSNQSSAIQIAASGVNAENNLHCSTINTCTTNYMSALSNSSTMYGSPLTRSSLPAIDSNNTNNNNNAIMNSNSSALTTSLGIIDIDQLTNSQLGFNNVLEQCEMPSALSQHQSLLPERRSLRPFITSDKNKSSNWKYQLDDTFNSPATKSKLLTNDSNNTNDNKLVNTTCNGSVISNPNDESKLFNTTANKLLQISFPENYVTSDSPPVVNDIDKSGLGYLRDPSLNSQNSCSVNENSLLSAGKSDDALGCENDIIAVEIKSHDNISVLHKENGDVNKGIIFNKTINLDSDSSSMNHLGENDISVVLPAERNCGDQRVETPPQQLTEFGSPVGFSTPTNVKSELRRKMTYDAITNKTILENGIGNGGRLSDSSTDTDIPSISMEDLTEEQVSPILNQTYNTNTILLNNSQNERSQLDQTYEVTPQSSKGMVKVKNNLTINKTRNALNNSGLLNSSFRKSPLNTTFCKSTEALNGGSERADSGPEDDCMSTASDSSFSSSSTHMRSVGEIQSIARLQEESLRQQTSRKKMAWSGSGGLSGTTAELRRSIPKLSYDDGNQSDQSDRSSDRYSPTTLNNNDSGAEANPGVIRNRSQRTYIGLKHFGGSSELHPPTGIVITHSGSASAASCYQRKHRTGLRPPTLLNKVSSQPLPISKTTVGQPPSAQTVPSGAMTATQTSLPRPSGIRPPSVIPRPVSRLPAPKVRSGLPKYNSHQGKH